MILEIAIAIPVSSWCALPYKPSLRLQESPVSPIDTVSDCNVHLQLQSFHLLMKARLYGADEYLIAGIILSWKRRGGDAVVSTVIRPSLPPQNPGPRYFLPREPVDETIKSESSGVDDLHLIRR